MMALSFGRRARLLAFPLAVVVSGCVPDSPREASAGEATAAVARVADVAPRSRPGYVVDSILPVDEELRRFRDGLGAPPVSFTGGADSREALVKRFFGALAASDTNALRAMLVSRAEFAYLVYPSSPYTHPPYRQPPGLVWMQLEGASARGVHRLLDRAGQYRYLGHRCAAPPQHEESNTLWRQCTVRVVRSAGDTLSARLFGVVVERGGIFKFASYESDF